MSELKTCFKRVDYDLSGLLHYIDIGDIGLPDIQRPLLLGWEISKLYFRNWSLLLARMAVMGRREIKADCRKGVASALSKFSEADLPAGYTDGIFIKTPRSP